MHKTLVEWQVWGNIWGWMLPQLVGPLAGMAVICETMAAQFTQSVGNLHRSDVMLVAACEKAVLNLLFGQETLFLPR